MTAKPWAWWDKIPPLIRHAIQNPPGYTDSLIYETNQKIGAQVLLDQMSPHVRSIVEQDAKNRLLHVLKEVRNKKYQRQVALFKLHSVLTQIAPQLEQKETRSNIGWGSW